MAEVSSRSAERLGVRSAARTAAGHHRSGRSARLRRPPRGPRTLSKFNPGSGPRILLAGGGSGGSVSPLIAVAEEARQQHPGVQLLFVGTRDGPERALAEAAGLRFQSVASG